MADQLSKLATRYTKALDAVYAAQEKAEEARRAWLAEAATHRAALLVELGELADAIGAVTVTRQPGRLALDYGARHLTFLEAEDGDTLDVMYPAAGDVSVVVGPQGQWSLVDDGDATDFIPDGLERLLISGLGLPDPDAPVVAEVEEGAAAGRGARDGEAAHLGRSGTRGYKRAKDLPPGAVVKDIKGPLG